MPAQAGDPNDTWDRLVPPVLPLSDDRLLDASLRGKDEITHTPATDKMERSNQSGVASRNREVPQCWELRRERRRLSAG